jgi:hypothetical protein
MDRDATEQLDDKHITTLLWNEFKDQNDWQRHNEAQRATLSTILLSISSALLAFYPKDNGDWTVPTLLIVIGVFGAVAVIKYWERFMYHVHKERVLRQLLDSYYPEGDAEKASQGMRLLLQTHEAGEKNTVMSGLKGGDISLVIIA